VISMKNCKNIFSVAYLPKDDYYKYVWQYIYVSGFNAKTIVRSKTDGIQ
jgi:hypothetical protein